jgi:O-antigen/teichoic acid export membrane protein
LSKFSRKAGGPDSDGTAAATVTHEDQPSTGEVRQRAVAGAAVDVLRGIGVRILGLFGMLVLAHLLTPHDFGMVAVGMTFVTFANFLADGGIGNGLIRRVDPPTRADLKALLAFQLALSTALAIGIGVALLPFGEVGRVAAIMVIALPLTSVRAPGVILLERRLSYKPFALVELIESICYYGWAIVLVSQGWGVWGLASASVVRALVGSSVILFMVPAARLIPSPSWARVRTLLGFGLRYQAVGVTNMFRELGTNAAIGLIAGVSALGVWSIAYRILQIPLVLLGSLWRVSFPGMSRLVAAKEDVGPTIERVVAVVAIVSGFILAPMVAATPAWVPALLGHQWTDAVAVIPPASLHLMVMGSISVALLGYLWALGEASAVLRATLVGLPLMAVVMLPLLPIIGASAVGFGWLASGLGEATVLILAARKHAEFSIWPRLVPPTLFAVLGAAVGWLVGSEVGRTVAGGTAGALSAVAVYLLALWIWHRSYLLDSVRLSMRGLRGVLKRSDVNATERTGAVA